MAEIHANGAHDANGSANWCTLRKFMQMVLMMQLVVQIGANGEHGANGGAKVQIGAKGAHGENGGPMVQIDAHWCNIFKITMHQITHWCKSLVLVCSSTCINMSNQ